MLFTIALVMCVLSELFFFPNNSNILQSKEEAICIEKGPTHQGII